MNPDQDAYKSHIDISPNLLSSLKELQAAQAESETVPLISRILSGVGAWLASWFLLSPMLSLALFEQSELALLASLVIMVVSWLIHRQAAGLFWQQVAVAFLFCANGLLLFAVADLWHGNELSLVSLCQLGVALLCYPLFANAFVRFLLPLTALVSVLAWLSFEDMLGWGDGLLFMVGIICISLWLSPGTIKGLRPLAFASAWGMLLILIWQFMLTSNSWVQVSLLKPQISLLILSGLLLVCWVRIALFARWPLSNYLPGLLLVIALSLVSTYGVLLALLLLLLGYWRDELWLLMLGRLTLAVVLAWYYYSLELNLIEKGLALMVTGLLLIAVAYLLARFTGKPAQHGEESL
ncbi:DUF4401 domain-containing protein [Aestuariirhabdus sp. Z084]|uniref:DUF4401 domain-containing protein n=1 Tax=Aestuariirhabdus haliotis TaxID=2918751 RepID=UPI00201B3C58|nr:DUF4401 domain-containing protein [Aestuariirhabdus haliotis]MCL6414654.1 DUF4401 domain-containing protein [Aestuariirhabdus haliotis]MCL6418364.1 DUF4401 domain-containing protein [Aestuariirhabdus haliotis]